MARRTTREDGAGCSVCGTKTTGLWRRGPEGPGTLCNRCGVRFKRGQDPVTIDAPKMRRVQATSAIERALPAQHARRVVAEMDELLIGYYSESGEDLVGLCAWDRTKDARPRCDDVTAVPLHDEDVSDISDISDVSPDADIALAVPASFFSIDRS